MLTDVFDHYRILPNSTQYYNMSIKFSVACCAGVCFNRVLN